MDQVRLTIEINRETYYRIQDAIKYIDLFEKFKGGKPINEINTEHHFIIGSIKEALNEIEIFSESAKIKTSNQKLRPLKNSIKFYLKKHDIKQVELAQMLGVDKSNLNMYLNNYKQPPIDMFLDIWAILDYPPIEELLYREDIKNDDNNHS